MSQKKKQNVVSWVFCLLMVTMTMVIVISQTQAATSVITPIKQTYTFNVYVRSTTGGSISGAKVTVRYATNYEITTMIDGIPIIIFTDWAYATGYTSSSGYVKISVYAYSVSYIKASASDYVSYTKTGSFSAGTSTHYLYLKPIHRVLVLVHGYTSDTSAMQPIANYFTDKYPSTYDKIINFGWETPGNTYLGPGSFWYFQYIPVPWYPYFSAVPLKKTVSTSDTNFADMLADKISSECSDSNVQYDIDIITHSTGGVIARAMIKYYYGNGIGVNGKSNLDIKRVMTLGAPNHGVPILDAVFMIPGSKHNNWQMRMLDSTVPLGYSNSWTASLNDGDETPYNIKYFTIAGNDNNDEGIGIEDWLDLYGENDGVVPTDGVALSGAVYNWVYYLSHSELRDPSNYQIDNRLYNVFVIKSYG